MSGTTALFSGKRKKSCTPRGQGKTFCGVRLLCTDCAVSTPIWDCVPERERARWVDRENCEYSRAAAVESLKGLVSLSVFAFYFRLLVFLCFFWQCVRSARFCQNGKGRVVETDPFLVTLDGD